MYRVLGRTGEDFHRETDAQIYNDYDFYQTLLSDFLQAHEHDALDQDESDVDEEREKFFLGNADLGLT